MQERLFARRDIVCSLAEPGWSYGHSRSPFYRYDLEQGATYCIYNRRMMPVSLTSSTREEGYWALRRTATRLDTGRAPTEIAGPDSGRLLDRIFTRQVSTLAVGRCTYGIACWPDGGVLVNGILFRLDEERFWYVQAEGDFVGWVSAHALAYDVEIRDPDSWVHQIQGPKALDVLADACDGGLPEGFRFFDVREVRVGGQPVLVTRTGWTGEVGFEVYTRPGIDLDALWDRFTEAGARHGMIDIGLDPMDIRRIEAGILNNISDMDRTMTPFDAGLGDFVDLERDDDFFGKEALRTADRRSRLYGTLLRDRGAADRRPGHARRRADRPRHRRRLVALSRAWRRLCAARERRPARAEAGRGGRLRPRHARVRDRGPAFLRRGEEDPARPRKRLPCEPPAPRSRRGACYPDGLAMGNTPVTAARPSLPGAGRAPDETGGLEVQPARPWHDVPIFEGRDLASDELWDLSRALSKAKREVAIDPPRLPKARRASVSLILAAVAAATPALASAHSRTSKASESAEVLERSTLERGDRGPAVERLQRALGVTADGIFGKQTLKAVRAFQKGAGLCRRRHRRPPDARRSRAGCSRGRERRLHAGARRPRPRGRAAPAGARHHRRRHLRQADAEGRPRVPASAPRSPWTESSARRTLAALASGRRPRERSTPHEPVADAGAPSDVDGRLGGALALARDMGLNLISAHRPGAIIESSGQPSDHGVFPSKAIDVRARQPRWSATRGRSPG